MDVDLPVWTIRPNWKGGVLERLEWQTDVLASDSGVEQRRSVRLSPRRSFEITVNPTRADRSYLDLVLHRLGSEEWLIPLWHDQARLAEPAVVGAQALMFDNTFREFRDGDYAILYHDTFTWEIVQVQTSWEGGLVLANDVERDWPTRTKVFPVRRALIQTETTLKALTTRVGESVILFQINEANDYAEAIGDDMVIFEGSPLLTRAPNWTQGIDTSHTRLFDEQDGGLGLIHRTDTVGRAFAVQSHNWQVTGREAQSSFRSFLYTLRGRQRMVWLPTFGDDMILAEPALAGTVQAKIEHIGYRYVGAGSPIPGRATLWTGQEVVRIGTVPAPQVPQEERLGLLAPLMASYAPGAAWTFLQAARLDQDTIEIHHNADSDGTFEVGAGFKTFANDRDPAGSNFNPIPPSVFTVGECGAPAGSNPCKFVPFNGIYLTVTMGAPNPCNACWDGNRSITIDEVQPNGPGGKTLSDINFYGGGCDPNGNNNRTIYENFEEGNPRLQGQVLAQFVQASFNGWLWQFYFPCVYRNVYIFPSARYCGSVGKDEGSLAVTVQYHGGGPIEIGPLPAGGLYNINFSLV